MKFILGILGNFLPFKEYNILGIRDFQESEGFKLDFAENYSEKPYKEYMKEIFKNGNGILYIPLFILGSISWKMELTSIRKFRDKNAEYFL